MRLPDGTEAVVRMEYPLSLSVAAALMKAVAQTLEGMGWTNVVLLTDGTDRIAGTPPASSQVRGG